MGWIDRHRRGGIVLALIALVLQSVLTFGHVHLRGVAQHASATIAYRTATHAPSQTPAQIPGDNDDYCAVCASIFLASNAFAPAPPRLLVPVNFQRVEHSFYPAQLAAKPPRLAFRSRAPPLV
jgi:uncharacterized iron-regulated membrane protein